MADIKSFFKFNPKGLLKNVVKRKKKREETMKGLFGENDVVNMGDLTKDKKKEKK